uniref:Uncharacterized protein n=1 Tax=Paramormyrops kingsleyae TaxID=1676925 RepID=A0A3B3R5P0_9TELE
MTFYFCVFCFSCLWGMEHQPAVLKDGPTEPESPATLRRFLTEWSHISKQNKNSPWQPPAIRPVFFESTGLGDTTDMAKSSRSVRRSDTMCKTRGDFHSETWRSSLRSRLPVPPPSSCNISLTPQKRCYWLYLFSSSLEILYTLSLI